eukprot:TRINITY_DN11834_c0_g1_i1.p1 TRINITY_DN11834_c0_g1~~TRINITY_DN11834_c0_g1_i1.p1  ORF type:complete len:637 (-),score=39.74 TRINITY_DN11834_c0_g1_i1:78-1964(-)
MEAHPALCTPFSHEPWNDAKQTATANSNVEQGRQEGEDSDLTALMRCQLVSSCEACRADFSARSPTSNYDIQCQSPEYCDSQSSIHLYRSQPSEPLVNFVGQPSSEHRSGSSGCQATHPISPGQMPPDYTDTNNPSSRSQSLANRELHPNNSSHTPPMQNIDSRVPFPPQLGHQPHRQNESNLENQLDQRHPSYTSYPSYSPFPSVLGAPSDPHHYIPQTTHSYSYSQPVYPNIDPLPVYPISSSTNIISGTDNSLTCVGDSLRPPVQLQQGTHVVPSPPLQLPLRPTRPPKPPHQTRHIPCPHTCPFQPPPGYSTVFVPQSAVQSCPQWITVLTVLHSSDLGGIPFSTAPFSNCDSPGTMLPQTNAVADQFLHHLQSEPLETDSLSRSGGSKQVTVPHAQQNQVDPNPETHVVHEPGSVFSHSHSEQRAAKNQGHDHSLRAFSLPVKSSDAKAPDSPERMSCESSPERSSGYSSERGTKESPRKRRSFSETREITSARKKKTPGSGRSWIQASKSDSNLLQYPNNSPDHSHEDSTSGDFPIHVFGTEPPAKKPKKRADSVYLSSMSSFSQSEVLDCEPAAVDSVRASCNTQKPNFDSRSPKPVYGSSWVSEAPTVGLRIRNWSGTKK